jgi:hypothetical protein
MKTEGMKVIHYGIIGQSALAALFCGRTSPIPTPLAIA